MGDGDCLDEMFLETRLDGGFNLFDALHELFDLIPGFGVEERVQYSTENKEISANISRNSGKY